MTKYAIVVYKQNGSKTFRGNDVASWDSSCEVLLTEDREKAAQLIAGVKARGRSDKTLDVSYDISVLVDGIPEMSNGDILVEDYRVGDDDRFADDDYVASEKRNWILSRATVLEVEFNAWFDRQEADMKAAAEARAAEQKAIDDRKRLEALRAEIVDLERKVGAQAAPKPQG